MCSTHSCNPSLDIPKPTSKRGVNCAVLIHLIQPCPTSEPHGTYSAERKKPACQSVGSVTCSAFWCTLRTPHVSLFESLELDRFCRHKFTEAFRSMRWPVTSCSTFTNSLNLHTPRIYHLFTSVSDLGRTDPNLETHHHFSCNSKVYQWGYPHGCGEVRKVV